ncbi:MAG: SagB/ThcOx family dehydrogenase, partial [Treponema sp.]|jgi:SagB-type dehydrogenase family enzyme|nr:SagB/ThcOx family dehydrogenase [Treponema sp.]
METGHNAGLSAQINQMRDFTKCNLTKEQSPSDQQKRLTQPPLCKASSSKTKIPLPTGFDGLPHQDSYLELLNIRRSERKYTDTAITLEQLAFMLWSTQGVQSIVGSNYFTLRPVPSGGARHPFETYVAARAVEGLPQGLYHYLPLENSLEYLGELPGYEETVSAMLAGQTWAAKAPLILFWSCIPYRAEWRYSVFAHRVLLIDLGHLGQNAMLSASALGLGSCCMAAYDQAKCDAVLGLDGHEEYTVYACAAGTIEKQAPREADA